MQRSGRLKKLFLDDKRPAPQGFVRVNTAQACMQALADDEIQLISLDYNLGRNKLTGYQVVKYMVMQKRFPETIIIHSNSPRGRMKMYRLLMRCKPKNVSVVIRPLPSP
jgi:hypothetical protein